MTGPVVIPDLHGSPHLLQRALDRFPNREFVLLGNYVDRGPDTPGLLALLRPLVEQGRAQALMGSHDSMMINILLHQASVRGWSSSYLDATLAQYRTRQAAIDDARWMQRHLPAWTVWRHVYLSHAAPHVAWNPDHEMPEHLWGRPTDPRRAPLPGGCTYAVHGHTLTREIRADHQPLPELVVHRDGTQALYLNTGAVFTDSLTVLDLDTLEFHALDGQENTCFSL